jgi:hypothetical protein
MNRKKEEVSNFLKECIFAAKRVPIAKLVPSKTAGIGRPARGVGIIGDAPASVALRSVAGPTPARPRPASPAKARKAHSARLARTRDCCEPKRWYAPSVGTRSWRR